MSPQEAEGFVRLGIARGDAEAEAWREALQKHGIKFHASVPDPAASIVLSIRSYEFRVREGDLVAAQEVLRSLGSEDKASTA